MTQVRGIRRDRTGLFLLGVAAALGLAWFWPVKRVEPKITLALRYDDYSDRSPLEFERELVEGIAAAGGRVTLGVIPVDRTTNRVSSNVALIGPLNATHVQALKTWRSQAIADVALHGFLHERHSSRESDGEFAGLPLPEQTARIARGRELLEHELGERIEMFIPPWNKYDAATVDALEKLGFSSLSADDGGYCRLRGALRYVPSTTTPATLAAAVQRAKRSGVAAPLIVLLVHSYDFSEIDPERGVTTRQKFVDDLKRLRVEDGIELVSLLEVVRREPDPGGVRRWLNSRMKLMPPWMIDSRRIDLRTADALAFLFRAAFFCGRLWIGDGHDLRCRGPGAEVTPVSSFPAGAPGLLPDGGKCHVCGRGRENEFSDDSRPGDCCRRLCRHRASRWRGSGGGDQVMRPPSHERSGLEFS